MAAQGMWSHWRRQTSVISRHRQKNNDSFGNSPKDFRILRTLFFFLWFYGRIPK